MKKDGRSHKLFLEDILLRIDRIEEYMMYYSFNDFKKDHKTVDAVIRNLEIGEASKNLPNHLREKYPEVAWAEMYLLRLRNKVSHEYFGIDYEIIWDVAKTTYLKTKLKSSIF